jgi:hypothetical protein
MDTTSLPDEQPVTLAWTSVLRYRHTFTLGQLRAAVRAVLASVQETASPYLPDDFYLLAEEFLEDFEDADASQVEYTRSITAHTGLGPAPLPVFTVTVAGPARHDGEAPYTYALHAADQAQAQLIATAWCIVEQELDLDGYGEPCEADTEIVHGSWDTFDGPPTWPQGLPGNAWTDLREESEALVMAWAYDIVTAPGGPGADVGERAGHPELDNEHFTGLLDGLARQHQAHAPAAEDTDTQARSR